MLVTRKELTYAWLSQLAGLILSEWDPGQRPPEVTQLLETMQQIQEPSGGLETLACLALLDTLLPHLGEWQCPITDVVIKEIKSRIYDYREKLRPAVTSGLRPVFTGVL